MEQHLRPARAQPGRQRGRILPRHGDQVLGRRRAAAGEGSGQGGGQRQAAGAAFRQDGDAQPRGLSPQRARQRPEGEGDGQPGQARRLRPGAEDMAKPPRGEGIGGGGEFHEGHPLLVGRLRGGQRGGGAEGAEDQRHPLTGQPANLGHRRRRIRRIGAQQHDRPAGDAAGLVGSSHCQRQAAEHLVAIDGQRPVKGNSAPSRTSPLRGWPLHRPSKHRRPGGEHGAGQAGGGRKGAGITGANPRARRRPPGKPAVLTRRTGGPNGARQGGYA